MKATKRAAILARVSTVSQSTERQTSELIELAKAQGFKVTSEDIYEDTISGFTRAEEREALHRLMTDISSGRKKYDMVFVWEVSRISRSEDEGWKILLFFSEYKTPIYVKTLGLTTHMVGEYDRNGNLKRNNVFKLVFAVMQQQAESEAELTRLRSTSTMRLKIKNEGHSGYGNNKAYGYAVKEKKLVIDPAEADVVRQIFLWSHDGMGTKVIAGKLNAMGVPTKKQKTSKKKTIITKGTGSIKQTKHVNHLRWEEGTLHSLLSNTIYKGIRKFKVDERLEPDGTRIPIHDYVESPVIIAPELFDAVQQQRSQRFTKASKDKRYLFLLKHICCCGKCGRYMAGRFKPQKENYYQCSSKRHSHINCGNISVNTEALEATVWDVVKNSVPLITHLMNKDNKKEELEKKIKAFQAEIKMVENEINDLTKQLNKWKKMFLTDIITEQELALEKIKLDKKTAAKKEVLENLKKKVIGVTSHLMKVENVKSYHSVLRQIQNNRFEIVEVIRNLVERVSVTAIEKHSNNTRYLIGLKIKGLEKPFAILLTNKQRNQHAGFITPAIESVVGQNRFKYLFCEGHNTIEWDSNGTLATPIDEAVEQLQSIACDPKKAVIHADRIQQWNYQGQVVDMNVCLVDSEDNEIEDDLMLEFVPTFLPFDDSNQIEKVKQMKPKLTSKLNLV